MSCIRSRVSITSILLWSFYSCSIPTEYLEAHVAQQLLVIRVTTTATTGAVHVRPVRNTIDWVLRPVVPKSHEPPSYVQSVFIRGIRILLWCKLWNPQVDLRFGSTQVWVPTTE